MSEKTTKNGVATDANPAGHGAQPQSATPPRNPAPDAVLGQVVWLMMNMPQYRHVFLADLEWMVLPPILLSQYRLFRAGDHVVAFAAWAYLSEDAEARLQGPNPRLAPSDWKSGDRLWLIDLHAPFGQQELALKELRDTALKGKAFKMHRWTQQGRQVVEILPEGPSHASA
ncbi:toxin-activating lysine-acyltransferase [Bradyrhizobium sp.]|uniref:toxin-activating lysine-acyltransferase n=1 Tax=Bradyrhizobium sp. TaxID=376 RepID=UPI001EC284AB|nr:toxin-activating lysine-acyltransferase [Bradyrhizobium sp.]MBV9984568.1 toxin-activating lysine-acyltransferase [Bradyrhizobium sp.]